MITISPFVAIGIALGVAYTLSPLSVLGLLALAGIVKSTLRGIDGDERRWLLAMLVAAIAARLVAVVGLFLASEHDVVAFRTFFGDESYFLQRSIWLRNFALGIPIHPADFVYAFEDGKRSSYTYVLALVQTLVGPSPYGAHVLSIVCYIAAAAILYRLARTAFGSTPALSGLAIVLFLPSLFAWSISVLKEPIYVLTLALGLAAAVAAGQPQHWARRVAAVVLVIVSAVAAQSLRDGGFLMGAIGGLGGLMAGLGFRRPRLGIVGAAAVLCFGIAFLSIGRIQDRIVFSLRHAAGVHWDNVNTPGYAYAILDGDFYQDRVAIDRLTLDQGVRFVGGALAKYVMVPEPWNTHSLAALAFVPEQVIWYLLVLLIPAGIVAGIRRDALFAALLMAYAAAGVVVVALTSGNVGTLVRHRGLAVPFLLWLSVVGAFDLWRRIVPHTEEAHAGHR